MKYDIKPKPTVFKSRQYRSRLEARWAAFFDYLGWQYEYEPFDTNTWSPDFLIQGTLLVEIKPFTTYKEFVDSDTIKKIISSDAISKYRCAVLGLYAMSATMLGWILVYYGKEYFEDELSIIKGDRLKFGVTETICAWQNILEAKPNGKEVWWNDVKDEVTTFWQLAANKVMFFNPNS